MIKNKGERGRDLLGWLRSQRTQFHNIEEVREHCFILNHQMSTRVVLEKMYHVPFGELGGKSTSKTISYEGTSIKSQDLFR